MNHLASSPSLLITLRNFRNAALLIHSWQVVVTLAITYYRTSPSFPLHPLPVRTSAPDSVRIRDSG